MSERVDSRVVHHTHTYPPKQIYIHESMEYSVILVGVGTK